MWKRVSKYVLIGCAALYAAAAALLWTSPTPYKVDLDSVLEIWADLSRDLDKFTKISTSVSIETEIEVGNSIASNAWFRIAKDQSLQDYVNDVGQRVAKNARRRGIPFQFHVVETSAINAWAIAGGHIYITTSMLDMMQSEAELAAVLGHEIAHVDLKHCIEMLQFELLMRRVGFGDLSILVSIAEQLVSAGFSEIQERDADRLGLLLAAEAGYSPFGALDAFERMYTQFADKNQESKQTSGPEGEIIRALSEALQDYFATHPPFLDRLDALQVLLDQNSSTWEGKPFYIGSSNHQDRVSRDRDERANELVTYSTSVPDYLLARASISGLIGRSNEALRFYTEALEKDPSLREAYEGRAGVYVSIGKSAEALNDLSAVIGLLNKQLESLEAKLLELPATTVVIETLDQIISVQLDLRSVYKSRIAIMEEFSDSGLKSENQKLEELNTAIFTNYDRRGELLLGEGRFQEALQYFMVFRSEYPKSISGITGTVRAEIGLRHYATALDVLFTAVAHYPDEAEFLSLRAEVYRLLGWAEKADREIQRYQRFVEDGVPPLWDEAWVEYIEMLDVLPDMKAMAFEGFRFDTGVASGWVYARTAAEQALKECAKSADHDCELYALGNEIVWGATDEELARIYEGLDFEIGSTPRELTGVRHLEDWVIRMQVRDATVEINAGNLKYLVFRANHNRELGEFESAIFDINRYLRSSPENSDVLLLRGNIYLEMRRFEKAIADFRRIIEISPQSKVAALSHSGIAGAFLMQNDYESAIQEYQAADLPETVQQFLDNGMCVALSRRALPAAALPYCNLAVLGHRGKNIAEFYDSRAFALWQLHRTKDAKSDLLVAKRTDPRLPDVYSRISQFRTLIVEVFLQEKGYTTGHVDGVYDSITKTAVTAYQTDENLPITDHISDDLVGSITPLGFGIYLLNNPPYITNSDIMAFCRPATRGEYTTVRGTNGIEYVCNSDGVSVRPVGSATIRDQGQLFDTETFRDQGQILDTDGLVSLGTDFFSQSITAGITGGLAAIEVLYEFNMVAPVQYSVYSGGNPVTGDLLYTELIESPVFETGRAAPYVYRWLLPSDTLFFEAGEQFTFTFQAQSSGVIFSASDRPDYFGGELFQNGVPSPKAGDVAFISYVVPAPAVSPDSEAVVEMPTVQLFGDGAKVVIHSRFALKAELIREYISFIQGKNYFGAFSMHRERDTFFYFSGFHSLEIVNQFALEACKLYSEQQNHDPDKCVLYASLIPTSVESWEFNAKGMGYPSYTAFSGEYEDNQKAGRFGAFAISGMGEDGYSWDYASKEEAVDEAVSVCEGWVARHLEDASKSERNAIESEGLTDCRIVHISRP